MALFFFAIAPLLIVLLGGYQGPSVRTLETLQGTAGQSSKSTRGSSFGIQLQSQSSKSIDGPARSGLPMLQSYPKPFGVGPPIVSVVSGCRTRPTPNARSTNEGVRICTKNQVAILVLPYNRLNCKVVIRFRFAPEEICDHDQTGIVRQTQNSEVGTHTKYGMIMSKNRCIRGSAKLSA